MTTKIHRKPRQKKVHNHGGDLLPQEEGTGWFNYDLGFTCLRSITYRYWFQNDNEKGWVCYKVMIRNHCQTSRGSVNTSTKHGESGRVSTAVTITQTHSTGNVLEDLPCQVVSRTGSEQSVGCPNHKGVLVAAGTKQRRQQLQHPT